MHLFALVVLSGHRQLPRWYCKVFLKTQSHSDISFDERKGPLCFPSAMAIKIAPFAKNSSAGWAAWLKLHRSHRIVPHGIATSTPEQYCLPFEMKPLCSANTTVTHCSVPNNGQGECVQLPKKIKENKYHTATLRLKGTLTPNWDNTAANRLFPGCCC